MEELFIKNVLKDKVRIKPAYLTNDIKQLLLKILREKYEGKCSQHGYIKPGSIRIDKFSVGYVQAFSLNGDIIFNISFFAEICNPAIGFVTAAKVVNMNKFGVLAEAYIKTKGISVPVLEIIVAKNMINIDNEVGVESLNIGDIIYVQIIGKKFELNDKKISIVGKTIANPKTDTKSSKDDDEDADDDGVASELSSVEEDNSLDEDADDDDEVEAEAEAEADDAEDSTSSKAEDELESNDELGSDADFDDNASESVHEDDD